MLLEEEKEANGRAFLYKYAMVMKQSVTRKKVVIAVMMTVEEILIELDNQLLDHMSQTWKV